MAHVVNHIYHLKRGTAQRWIELNPILDQGEPGFEYDTNKLKIGDGIRAWKDLPYIAVGESFAPQGEAIITVEDFIDLPSTGDTTKLYRVISESKLYQWNQNKYEALGGGEGTAFDPSTITLINGGKSNG